MNEALYVGLTAAALLALAALLGGLGLLAARLLGARPRTADELELAPWTGWALALLILQLWHLALPVDDRALALVALAGLAGLAAQARDLWRWLGSWRVRSWTLAAALALAALWVANQTTTQPKHPDSPLYHIVCVRWAAEYPVVPGLANLRNIFGYNSTFFLYAALLDAGPFTGRSHHLAAGLLLFLLLARSLRRGGRLLAADRPVSCAVVFDALLLVPILLLTMGDYGSSPSPDVAVFALGIVLVSELLRQGESVGAAAAGDGGYRALSAALLAVAGVTVKLTFAGAAAAALALTVWAQARPGVGRGGGGARRWWLCAAGLCGLLGAVWIARGIIVSGYPFYPSTALAAPVEWRLPAELARANADTVRAWARQPGAPAEEALRGWRWLRPWAIRMLRDGYNVVLPLTLACVLAPVWWRIGRGAEGPARVRRPWAALAVPLAGLLFWFGTAPEPRFAGSAFWALAAGALALAVGGGDALRQRAAAACVVVPLFFASVDLPQFVRPWNQDRGPVRRGAVEALQTRSGLTVFVPVEGGHCWDAPLPCTTGRAFLDPDLRLRVAGRLERGFVIDRAPAGPPGP